MKRRYQDGIVGPLFITFLVALIGAAIFLYELFSTLLTSEESEAYRKALSTANEIAQDPNAHTDAEVSNSGKELVALMRKGVDKAASNDNVVGGWGIQTLLKAEKTLRKIEEERSIHGFIIKIVASPADPAPFQDVLVTITLDGAGSGVSVSYSVSGTDGYHQSNTLVTDSSGTISFTVPGGAGNVTDTITVTAGSATQTFNYTF